MGLLDILNGMQNGPRGQSAPAAPGSSSGGMSPITMALLGLLAWKAIKHLSPAQAGTNPAAPVDAPPAGGGGLGGMLSGGLGGLLQGGGLGNLLKGPLGGLLAGGAAGGLVSGGLSDILKQFQQNGLGDQAKSWVDNGPNQEVSPSDLSKALGEDQIQALMSHTGMARDELMSGLSQELPEFVNRLTPHGRVPTEQEASNLA